MVTEDADGASLSQMKLDLGEKKSVIGTANTSRFLS